MADLIYKILNIIYENINLIFIISVAAIIPIQSLLCFKAKKLAVRTIPLLFYLIMTLTNIAALFLAAVGILDIGGFFFALEIMINGLLLAECVLVFVVCLILSEFISRKKKE